MQNLNLQFNEQGKLRHLLSLESFTPDLFQHFFDTAAAFQSQIGRDKFYNLKGRTVVNIFFENSTRTRTTFELAAKALDADVLNFNITTSATSKGESLLDTIYNLQAMHADMFVIRHPVSGAAHFIAEHVKPHIAVINAGDGCHAHPSQALLDMYTIAKHKTNFQNLKVVIVGDILHSRVARSQIQALMILGVPFIGVCAPKTLLPSDIERMGVHVYHDLEKACTDADVIITLRLQKERMETALIPSFEDYFYHYGLTAEKIKRANKELMILHPGPINRGVEIASEVADGAQSFILEQVANGTAMRMAIMATLMDTLKC